MAGRGRDSESLEAPRARAGEVRGRGEPSPSGGRPGNRELAPGPPSSLSQRNPRVERPPRAETKSRGAGGKVVGGRAAGASFVRLGLGGLRPAAFPGLRRARQGRGLRGHRRLPGESGAGSRGRGPPPGASAGPLRITQQRAALGLPQASGARESDPQSSWARGSRREEKTGAELEARGRRSAGE